MKVAGLVTTVEVILWDFHWVRKGSTVSAQFFWVAWSWYMASMLHGSSSSLQMSPHGEVHVERKRVDANLPAM